MALLHRAELTPTKLELLEAWLPSRGWCEGDAAGLERVAAYRFDDPAGEVGVETILVQAAGGGPVHHVPLTYRGARLDGGDRWLIGTTEHSVLGRRWVYDACGDPVYASVLASAILGGTGQAEQYFEVNGRRELSEPTMTVIGSGGQDTALPVVDAVRRVVEDDPTLIVTDPVELAVVRRLDGGSGPAGATLTGRWSGQPTPVTLAYATPR